MEDDGFTLVEGKKKSKKSKYVKKARVPNTVLSDDVNFSLVYRNIYLAADQIQSSPSFSTFQSALETALYDAAWNTKVPLPIVCYGLGHVSSSKVSQTQTGLLLVLKQLFTCTVEVYDPIFTSADKEVLRRFDFSVSENNEEGKRAVGHHQPVVFYMPHCGKPLYNNLLWANWERDKLSSCIIIGNSFKKIVQNFPTHTVTQYYNYILMASKMVKEIPMSDLVEGINAFNDMTLMMFLEEDLKTSRHIWDVHIPPAYPKDETEIIYSS